MCKRIFAVFLLLTCALLAAQQALNNDAVIKLVKAGLSDDLIVSTINAQAGTYDTSTDGLIALKTAGVSDKVVAAMVAKASAVAGATSATSTAAVGTDPDDPAAAHEAGIYVYVDGAPAGSKMMMLEPSIYSQGKTGGVFASAMTYGIAKIKMKAVIRGAHSNTRISGTQPTFYFCFEQQGAGLSNSSLAFGGTSTPNEYTLLKFDVKGNTRETIIGQANAFGASTGTDEKASTGFTYTKIRPGVYKVALSAPLQPGEYGFISAAAATTSVSRVFDFGKD